jgi:hypothetical protein
MARALRWWRRATTLGAWRCLSSRARPTPPPSRTAPSRTARASVHSRSSPEEANARTLLPHGCQSHGELKVVIKSSVEFRVKVVFRVRARSLLSLFLPALFHPARAVPLAPAPDAHRPPADALLSAGAIDRTLLLWRLIPVPDDSIALSDGLQVSMRPCTRSCTNDPNSINLFMLFRRFICIIDARPCARAPRRRVTVPPRVAGRHAQAPQGARTPAAPAGLDTGRHLRGGGSSPAHRPPSSRGAS